MGFEIVEHTADVGIRASAGSPEELFEQTTLGLLEIIGAWRPGEGEPQDVDVEADDMGALLVYWLEEILYFQDARDSVITSLDVREVAGGRARGSVGVSPSPGDLEGTAVKAITYHRLAAEQGQDGNWVAQVYLDI